VRETTIINLHVWTSKRQVAIAPRKVRFSPSSRWAVSGRVNLPQSPFQGLQNSARQGIFICARIDIPFATLLPMRRLAFFVALLFAGLSSASAQWEIEESHTTADLRGIDNVGNGIVWASGAGGTVLRTKDNGTHWQTCAVPTGAEKLDFRGIRAFDANTAIVMSSGKGDLSRSTKPPTAAKPGNSSSLTQTKKASEMRSNSPTAELATYSEILSITTSYSCEPEMVAVTGSSSKR
jgi:hypothetical protein